MTYTSKALQYLSMSLVGMLLFLWVQPGLAQSGSIPTVRSHALNASDQPVLNLGPMDTLTIVGVRVAFQADDNELTSGDGTFGVNSLPYLNSSDITIDPLPHNRAYFESHLAFAKNYFEKVSGGQVNIAYKVLPGIYTLDEKMAFYAPTGATFNNEKLAFLARDTWLKVEEQGGFDTSGLDPEKTAFVLFHAGVGRDIELTGTTLDITPLDIPSVTLTRNSLSRLLGLSSFQGFPVNGGSFRVQNSLILPRTLSRRGEDIAGNELVLQLSINGLLAASVGSYLGLPDLFNTETGASGIGRFGLMDGESIFSYRGLFPPEPSAWEKKHLGWQIPFDIPTDESQISLPAASMHLAGSIGRQALSGSEYFLVENRHRDPRQDNLTLTIQKNDGTVVQQHFTNRDQVFNTQQDGFEDLLEAGVLIDVDNYDWSLPGGLDIGSDGQAGTGDDRILNGGMLIWHIDEAVIESRINEGSVNADPTRRGVDLEEADGAQDIGTPAGGNFSAQARGTAFDFWWSGNDARVITLQGDTLQFYENRFGDSTRPDNKSNSGAPSFFEFYSFSGNLPTATFRARKTSLSTLRSLPLAVSSIPNAATAIPPGSAYENFYPKALSVYTAQADSFLIVPGAASVYALQLTDSQSPLFDFRQPASQHPFLGEHVILADAPSEGSGIDLQQWLWNGSGWAQGWQAQSGANRGFLSSVTGDTLFVDFTQDRILTDAGNAVSSLSKAEQQSAVAQGRQSILTKGSVRIRGTGTALSLNTDLPRVYTGVFQSGPSEAIFYVFTDKAFSLIEEQEGSLFPLVENTEMGWPAMVDLNDDGSNDILYVDKGTHLLEAKNQRGATLNYFPIQPPPESTFMGTPLIADIEGDGIPDILVLSQDSLTLNIRAYNDRGQPKEGFPLFVGSVISGRHQPVEPVISNKTLYAVSHTGTLKAWKFPRMDKVIWPSKYGGSSFNKVSGQSLTGGSSAPASAILVRKETYNWPNPASEQTHIRYRLQGAGTVEIKIIKPGGKVVYHQRFDAAGGMPEEQRIDTSGWGSGIYLAMVTATVNNRQARKLIKIAVVH